MTNAWCLSSEPDGDGEPTAGGRGLGRSGRMSRQRKMAALLRLLRGEDLDQVSRSLGVAAATLSGWREAFLNGGEAALVTRPTDAKPIEVGRLKAKLGEMMLEREQVAEQVAALEGSRPLARRRSRR